MRASSLATAVRVGAAGNSSLKSLQAPIKYTILQRQRFTDATAFLKLSGNGAASTDTTAPLWPGQTAHVRFAGHGTVGGIYGTPLATTWDFTGGNYLRFSARCNNYTYGKQFSIILADTKAAYQAGNFVRYNSRVSPSSGATANWFAANTWVFDGISPTLMATLGTGISNLAAVGYIAFGPGDTNLSNPTIWDIGEVQLIKGVGTKAKVVIWHDDSVPVGAAPIFSKLAAYGWAGSAATEWESIPNTSGAAGAFPVASMRAGGWTFGTHAITPGEHTDVPDYSVANQAFRAKLQNYRFNAAGEGADFTYWGGLKAQNAYEPVRMFYRSGRWNSSGLTYPDMQPPADPGMMKAILVAVGETFATNWQPLLNNAITVKGIAQFVFHQDISSNSALITEFDSMLAWLDSQRANIDVVTLPVALAASIA